MAAPGVSPAAVRSLPVPRPKSPPEYPDLYGKRRELAKVVMLEREIGFLQEELKSVEDLQPASFCIKEVADYVVANPEPLIPKSKKTRKSCRFWKWLCGKSCLNASWMCCCDCPAVKKPRCCGGNCCMPTAGCCSCSLPKCNCRCPQCCGPCGPNCNCGVCPSCNCAPSSCWPCKCSFSCVKCPNCPPCSCCSLSQCYSCCVCC